MDCQALLSFSLYYECQRKLIFRKTARDYDAAAAAMED